MASQILQPCLQRPILARVTHLKFVEKPFDGSKLKTVEQAKEHIVLHKSEDGMYG